MSWAPRSWNCSSTCVTPVGERHADLASVGRVLVPDDEPHLRQPVDIATGGGLTDTEPGRERRHPDPGRALDEVQRLRLLHGHVQGQECRHVGLGGQLTHPLEDGDELR